MLLVDGVKPDKTRVPLAEASALAAEAVELLAPYCERIEIAGSIRRQRQDVGDIELVCIPRMTAVQPDLFEAERGDVSAELQRVKELIAEGVLEHRLDANGHQACGPRFQRLVYKGFALDVFAVLPPAQFGVILAIRTGPAAFSKKLVTSRLAAGGGCMRMGQCVVEGALMDRGKVIETPEEADFFAAIGMEVPLPWHRF